MKFQASAALAVILVWLLSNNANLTAEVVDSDLGTRTETFLLKEIEPIIGQLALVSLVASAVIWLTGGLIRKIISGLASVILFYLSFLAIQVSQSIESSVTTKITLSGELSAVSGGVLTYLLASSAALSGLLFLASIKTYSVDRTARPRMKSDRDTWRSQDEGKDPTG